MAKLEKGDRVGAFDGKKLRYTEYGDDPYYGVITDELSDGRVVIKWDDKWYNDHSKPMNPEKLAPEKELKAKFSALEEEFKRVEKEVQDKLKEAGVIILDAQKMAKEAGFDLQELHEATYPLESAMGKAGWNTSSWHC